MHYTFYSCLYIFWKAWPCILLPLSSKWLEDLRVVSRVKNNTSDPCLSKIQTARESQSTFINGQLLYNRSMEEPGEQRTVVIALIVTELASESVCVCVEGGCHTPLPTSPFRNNLCKDDRALLSRFLHAIGGISGIFKNQSELLVRHRVTIYPKKF